MQPEQLTAGQRVAAWVKGCVSLTLFTIAILLAWRNVRQGRGDIRGASRLAAFLFSCWMLVWLCTAHHVPTGAELEGLFMAVSWALLTAAIFWGLYVALEPHVRRRWPQSMIAWSRVLGGGIRDPLVGGHLLIGVVFGVAYTLLFFVGSLVATGMLGVNLNSVVDAGRMTGVFIDGLNGSIMWALIMFFLFFLLRALLRRPWIAAVVFVLYFATMAMLGSEDHPLLGGTIFLIMYGLAILILIRFGVLPMVVGNFVSMILPRFPLTTDFSTWYAGSTIFALASVLTLTAYAFHTAIAGRPLFKEGFLETVE